MPTPLRSFFFLTLLLGFAANTQAQENNPVRDTLVTVKPGQTYVWPLQKAGAVALRCDTCVLPGSYFLQGKDTIKVVTDPHEDQSALVSLENPGETVTFYSGTISGSLQVLFINSGTVKATERKKTTLREGSGDCAFEVIPTSVWRAGLAAPTYTRSYTKTNHVAVHHAAGSNTATDHFKAVRDIYLYHRNSNGWSDIGYNYLIAPDGTIFQGRDNPAGTFDNDYVLGAHLCSNNSNAMGICLLGDYTNILPTQKAMESLYKVIKWKVQKDNLDIFGSTSHTIGPSTYMITAMMPNVLGHRDGCKAGYTACPGNMLYTKMDEIRTQVSVTCPNPLAISDLGEASRASVFPNPTTGTRLQTQFPWTSAHIYSLGGKLLQTVSGKASQEINVQDLASGVYLFHFQTPEYGQVVRRVVVN